MTAHSVVSLLLRLQNATTDAEANELIDRLADPFLRAVVRREWADLQASQTTHLTTGEPA